MTKNKDIREAVEAELGFDPLVDTTDITVRNMNGDVALNGTVPSYPQYLEAAAAAQRIDGVKNDNEGTGHTSSPAMSSGERLVARTATDGHLRNSTSATRRAAFRTCSQQSSTSRTVASRRYSTAACSGERLDPPPTDSSTAPSTRPGSASEASSTK